MKLFGQEKSRPMKLQLSVVVALLTYNVAGAHLFLSAEILSDAMEPIERIAEQLGAQRDGSDDAEAWFELGTHAVGLTRLLNDEVSGHGNEQGELLQSALDQAAAVSVKIFWSEEHRRYFYDGTAFDRYLALAPEGSHAGFSRFQRIETQFYLAAPTDRAGLEARVADKRDFLERFPKAGTRLRVSMFLGVDYRDLWRLCRAASEPECADRYRTLAEEQFSLVANSPSAGETAAVAERMMQRIAVEADDTSH